METKEVVFLDMRLYDNGEVIFIQDSSVWMILEPTVLFPQQH